MFIKKNKLQIVLQWTDYFEEFSWYKQEKCPFFKRPDFLEIQSKLGRERF